MATVIVKGYEVNHSGIRALDFNILYEQYKNILFQNAKNKAEAYNKTWNEIKQKVLKDPNKKKVDDMTYSVALNQGGKMLLFAHGTGKKETLEKIFLAEKENLDKSNASQNKASQEQPVSQPQTISTKTINLEDNTISFEDKYNAITSKDSNVNIVGKLNEDDSYAYYRNLLGQDKVDLFIKSKDYESEFFKALALVVKNNKDDIDKFTYYTSSQIANILKNLMQESQSNPEFHKEICG